VAARHPDAVVIGSDQVADLDGEPIGKPGTTNAPCEQLHAHERPQVVFQTAVAVVRRTRVRGRANWRRCGCASAARAPTRSSATCGWKQPYDCAGSAKSETLGIALLSAIDSDDPTALVGLPLDPHLRTAAPGRPRPAGATSDMNATPGRLLLVPNTLDHGNDPGRHRRRAARRACCARPPPAPLGGRGRAQRPRLPQAGGALVPLAHALQSCPSHELPRPRKGSAKR
jgi:hypothetical protein